MGEIVVTETSTIATPSSGNVTIAPKTDGKLYIKDDTGTETDLTAGGNAVTPDDFDASGDLLVGSGSNTFTNLSTPTLSAGDGDRALMVEDSDDGALVWKKHMSNDIDLNYVNAATYTIDYDTDHVVVGVYATSDMTFTFPNPTHFATTGRGKEYIFKNADTTGKILTVKLYGTGTFQNGLNELKVISLVAYTPTTT